MSITWIYNTLGRSLSLAALVFALTGGAGNLRADGNAQPREVVPSQANQGGACALLLDVLGYGSPEAQARLQERIAADARKYVEAKRDAMLRRSAQLNRAMAEGTRAGRPMRVDVLAFGAGPHSGVFLSNLTMANPNLRVLAVDASDGRFGTFDNVRGFRVNTREQPANSGNTFPGVPIQPRDLNARGAEFVDARNFGDVTVLAHSFAGGQVAFGNRVSKVTENPRDPNDPSGYRDGGRYRVEMENGNVVVTDAIFAATGLGDPKALVADGPSQEIVRRELDQFDSYAATSVKGPRVSVVDNFLRLQDEDVSAGRDPMARYEGGVIAVIGAGDGGNIAVEGALRLTDSLNPRGLSASNPIVWIGQKATTGDEFVNAMKPGKQARYGAIRKGFDTNMVQPAPGRLVGVREIDENGRKRFELTYEQFDPEGRPIPGTRVATKADHVVFATGYENRVMEPFRGLVAPNGAGNIDLRVVAEDTRDFTNNIRLAGEAPVAGQVTVDGTPHAIYIGGNAAADRPGDRRLQPTESDWQWATGGYLDILLGRTAALGRSLGPTLGPRNQPPPAQRFTRLQGSATTRINGTLPLPSRGLSLFDNLTGTTLALREEAAHLLAAFRYPPKSPVIITIGKGVNPGDAVISVEGLTPDSARALETAFAADSAQQTRRLLRDYFEHGGGSFTINLVARSDGSPQLEVMEMGPPSR
jgi:hypothetical protein